MIGEGHPMFRIVRYIMAYNHITINDNINTLRKLVQTNGVLQGYQLSPLLFNIATAEIVTEIKTE
jgi:hypothetical protein